MTGLTDDDVERLQGILAEHRRCEAHHYPDRAQCRTCDTAYDSRGKAARCCRDD